MTVTHQHPHYRPPARRSTVNMPAVATAVIVGVFVLAVVAAIALTRNDNRSEPTPDPISRAELFDRYLDLVPDREATEASVASLAATACDRLGNSVTPNDLVDSTTEVYGDRATARQVLHLLVSYGCPQHLDAL